MHWLMLILLQSSSWGAIPMDFTGSWVLDQKKSDSMDELLKLTGRSWLERQAAKSMSVTHDITQTGDIMNIHVSSIAMERTDLLKLDGTPVDTQDRDGQAIQSVTEWSASNNSLVTHSTAKLADGTRVPIHMARSIVQDGQTMEIHFQIEVSTAETLKMKRVFQRQP